MATTLVSTFNPNEINVYRNEAVWNHNAGTLTFNNTTGSESVSIAHRGGASFVLGNQVTSEFSPNNRQSVVQGDSFTTVKGSQHTITYTNREDRTFGDHHFITGSPSFLNNILASKYIEIQAEIATMQCMPENGIPGRGNNSNADLLEPPGDIQAKIKEKEKELTELAQSMGEGGNIHFLSCKHINIMAGTSPVNFDSGILKGVSREVKGGSTYTGSSYTGEIINEITMVPQFDEVNTASTIPFGDVTINAAAKINLQAGAGGVDIKSAGSMKFVGSGATILGGSQVMVTSPGSIYVTSKYTEIKSDGNVNIAAPQTNIDSKLTAEQAVVMNDTLAVAGDTTMLGNAFVKAGIAAGAGIIAAGSMTAAVNMVAGGAVQAGGIVSSNTGNSDNWSEAYSVVQANSAYWSGGGSTDPAIATIVQAQSANNASVYTTVNTTSANWSNVYSSYNLVSGGLVNNIYPLATQGNVSFTKLSGGSPITFTLDNLGSTGNPIFNNLTITNTINGITVGNGAGNIITNTVAGALAFSSNTTGIGNIALGIETLKANTSGNENTGVGARVLFTNTNGGQNTGIGIETLYSNNGNQNTAIGYIALRNNVTGNYNTAIGAQALRYNIAGNEGVGVGFSALKDNITGVNNTAVGTIALQQNTTGNNNTAVGRGSLWSSLSGSNNTAIGNNSMLYNLSGNGNTAVGASTLVAAKTVNGNTAIGWSSLISNLYGDNNTAIGYSALGSLTVGANNNTIGYASLYNNISGANNTAIGTDAGRYYYTSVYNNNLAPTNSIYIGYQATGGVDSYQNNQIVIGSQAFGFGSNTVTIGNNSVVSTVLKGLVSFGGTSSLFPALKRNGVGTGIEAKLADDSDFASIQSLYHRLGSGSPEGVVSAPTGALYSNLAGGELTTLYVKISGTSNTGWRRPTLWSI